MLSRMGPNRKIPTEITPSSLCWLLCILMTHRPFLQLSHIRKVYSVKNCFLKNVLILSYKSDYRISENSFLPWIVSTATIQFIKWKFLVNNKQMWNIWKKNTNLVCDDSLGFISSLFFGRFEWRFVLVSSHIDNFWILNSHIRFENFKTGLTNCIVFISLKKDKTLFHQSRQIKPVTCN